MCQLMTEKIPISTQKYYYRANIEDSVQNLKLMIRQHKKVTAMSYAHDTAVSCVVKLRGNNVENFLYKIFSVQHTV